MCLAPCSANRPRRRPVLVLDLSTSLAIGAIPASTEIEDENDDEDDDDSGGINTALNAYQSLPWVSRNKRFALKRLEMRTRSGSKVRSLPPPCLNAAVVPEG